MSAFMKLLTAMLAAALLSACGASSVSDLSGGKPQGAGSAVQPAALTGAAPAEKGTPTPEQEAAVRRAVLSATSMTDPKSTAYKIGPLDVLEVTVFKVPDLSKSVQVSDTGTINYPLVGELLAGGKTAREVERELTKAFAAKYLQNPQVTVFVKEYNSQRVTIEGAVKKPGVVPMVGGMSLLQAIAQAQGLEQTADSTVAVFRTVNGKRSAAKYNIEDIRQGKADDPPLQAGDVIIVPTSDVKEGVNTALKFLPLAAIIPLL